MFMQQQILQQQQQPPQQQSPQQVAPRLPSASALFPELGVLPPGMGFPVNLFGPPTHIPPAPPVPAVPSAPMPEAPPPAGSRGGRGGARRRGGAGAAASADSDDSSDGNGRGKQGEVKTTAIQEKNRRAQKRFRERQKMKMKDMTEELDDMTDELSKLRVENGALKNRNSILEKVLALRDEHIRVLQDEQHVFDLGNHYLQTSNPKLLVEGSKQPALLAYAPGVADDAVTNGPDPGNTVALAAPGRNAALAQEIAAVKMMPSDVVISRWKETVRELGNLLVTLEGCPDPSSPRHQEASAALNRVLEAASTLCMHTAVLHPTNMQRLIATALDDGRSGVSSEDRSRWAAVTASLALSPEQRGQVIQLRAIFLRRMRRVVEDRRVILDKLQNVTIPDRMLALQAVIAETLKVNECTVELKANLQEEHLAGMEFIGTVFRTIFNPLQKARAIVQSYPFYPDVYQIATALVAEQQGQDDLGLTAAMSMAGTSGVSASSAVTPAGVVQVPADFGALIDIPITYNNASAL